jgi:hypothetical protein
MKDRIFDPIRGRAIKALPEERVRASLVEWLIREAGVPVRLIAVEYSLSKLDPRSRKRADVVVWRPSGGTPGGLRPWLLAECKAPGVALKDATVDQIRRYAENIGAEYLLMTNGKETPCFRLDGERYVRVSGLPRFPE